MLTFRTLGVLILLLGIKVSFAQTDADKCIQIIVKDANTIAKAQEVDAFVRTQNGVVLTRMDNRTGLFFALYDSSQIASSESFIDWIESLGFNTLCSEVSSYGNGERIIKMSRSDCPSSLNVSE